MRSRTTATPSTPVGTGLGGHLETDVRERLGPRTTDPGLAVAACASPPLRQSGRAVCRRPRSPMFWPVRAKFGPAWPIPANIGQCLPHIGRFGHRRPKFGKSRPTPVNVGQMRPTLAEHGQTSTPNWSMLANSWLSSVRFSQPLGNIDHKWPSLCKVTHSLELDHFGPTWRRCWPNLGSLGYSAATVGQPWGNCWTTSELVKGVSSRGAWRARMALASGPKETSNGERRHRRCCRESHGNSTSQNAPLLAAYGWPATPSRHHMPRSTVTAYRSAADD